MVKITCPRCGANFNFGNDTTQAQADAALAQHIEREHGTVESKHRDYLEASRDAFGLIAGRGKITPLEARDLHNTASDLLSKPRLAIEEAVASAPAPVAEVAAPAAEESNNADTGGSVQALVPENLLGSQEFSS